MIFFVQRDVVKAALTSKVERRINCPLTLGEGASGKSESDRCDEKTGKYTSNGHKTSDERLGLETAAEK